MKLRFLSEGFITWGVVWLGLFSSGTFAFAAPARSARSLTPTTTEKYVLEKIAAGKVADLLEAFGNESNRVVRGALLEDVLTGLRTDCVIHRNGVLLEGAVIPDGLDLRNAQIPHETRLARCRFLGEVNFSKGVFENSLSLESSTFAASASFYAMKIGRGLFLSHAVFDAPADFTQIEVTGVLSAGQTSFRHPSSPAQFASMKVGGNAFFTNASFAGPVTFQYGHVAENFKLDNARFTNSATLAAFETMKVVGITSVTGAVFRGYVSFRDATFNTLDLSNVTWPDHASGEWLWLNGMTFQRIVAGSEQESWGNLLTLVDRSAHRSAYSTDIYTCLAGFYRREGYPRQANLFSIAQKRREREEVLHGAAWCWNLFLDWFVGYGRSPERAFFWSMAIVLFGTWVFRPHRMEPRNTTINSTPEHFSPFWYSVDLFLPLVKLQDAEIWKPRDNSGFARFWSRIHTTLGWALIPIAVAAWTGMLER